MNLAVTQNKRTTQNYSGAQQVETEQPSQNTLSNFALGSKLTSTINFDGNLDSTPPILSDVAQIAPGKPFLSAANKLTFGTDTVDNAGEQQNKHPIPTFFETVKRAPEDPIFKITDLFNRDTNPNKVNLGVGIYTDAEGKIPLLDCVQKAESALANNESPRPYLPITGLSEYNKTLQGLVFGEDSSVMKESRVVTAQAIGGTGGLSLGADLLKRHTPDAQVWVSDPSWGNHRDLFEFAGFKVNTYSYYDPNTHGVNFEGMLASIKKLPRDSIVVLHACCHNPTGADLTADQWDQLIHVVKQKGLIPFLDMAYQGFGKGIEADRTAVDRFVEAGVGFFVANSFSKSFSYYSERVGGLSIVAPSTDIAQNVISQLSRDVRTNYSNPPGHGAKVIATILSNPELRVSWERDLTTMCNRIQTMRHSLVTKLAEKLPERDFSFILEQNGMFSYMGITKAQVAMLRDKFSVYVLENGRINIAALNEKNIDYVVEAIYQVLSKSSKL